VGGAALPILRLPEQPESLRASPGLRGRARFVGGLLGAAALEEGVGHLKDGLFWSSGGSFSILRSRSLSSLIRKFANVFDQASAASLGRVCPGSAGTGFPDLREL
jgi:hypothetical protein